MKLNFKKLGNGDPLVILHGLFGSADNWFSIGRELEKEYSLYLVDQRNHGDSPHTEDWNYQLMAEDLAGWMQEEGLEKAHLMGHSMGGKTAMNFALAHPDKVNKLIVADIAPRHYPVHHQQILKGLKSLDLKTLKSRKDADDQLSEYIPEAGIRQFLLKNLTRDQDNNFKWKINLPVIDAHIEQIGEALKEGMSFDGPTLFMGGAKSDYIKESDRPDLEKFFPNHHLIYIKDAGHWLHAEQPAAVVETIKAFLK